MMCLGQDTGLYILFCREPCVGTEQRDKKMIT